MTQTVNIDGAQVTLSDAEYAARFPAPPPPGAPQSVTRRQGRLALNAAGLLTSVEAAIAAADEPTQIWYQDADTWERTNPIILGLAAKLGISDAQMDTLFTQAATL